MTNEEKVQYWIELSDYDMDTSEAMLQSKRYLYVGFTCHQVIEKIFKACYAKLMNDVPPFTHDLPYLAIKGGFYELFSKEQKEFIDEIEPLNIKTRYPDYKKELMKQLDSVKCTEIIENTKTLQQWTKEKIL